MMTRVLTLGQELVAGHSHRQEQSQALRHKPVPSARQASSLKGSTTSPKRAITWGCHSAASEAIIHAA